MKQIEDQFTADMFGKPEGKPTYRFFINAGDTTIAWSNLTRREAMAIHKLMAKQNPLQSNVDVTRFGWEELK